MQAIFCVDNGNKCVVGLRRKNVTNCRYLYRVGGFLGDVTLNELFTDDASYGKKYAFKIYSASIGVVVATSKSLIYESSDIKVGIFRYN